MGTRKSLIWGAVFALAAVGLFTLVRYQASIYATFVAWELVPKPETFTELYFENPSALPHEIAVDEPFSFAFTIHNLEGATTTYPYQVYLQYPTGEVIPLTGGQSVLANNAVTTITAKGTLHYPNQQFKVVVTLPSKNQHIDFSLVTTE